MQLPGEEAGDHSVPSAIQMLSRTSTFSSYTMFWQHLLSPANNMTSQKKAEATAAVASHKRICSQGQWHCLLCWPHSSCLQAQEVPGSQVRVQPLCRLCFLLRASWEGLEMPVFRISPQTLLPHQKPHAKCTYRSPAISLLPTSWCPVRTPASAGSKCQSGIVSSLRVLRLTLALSYTQYAVAGMGQTSLISSDTRWILKKVKGNFLLS